eukprot:Skav211838  [mRNA]  locus=scaffold305:724172:735602:+ [translate_table: standard]
MDDFFEELLKDDDTEDAFSLQSVVVGLIHLGTIVIICRACCCGASRTPAPPTGGQVEVANSALQQRKRLLTSYLLWLNPFVPAHHFYLQRHVHGLTALWTANFALVGWVLDGFLMPWYVSSFNNSRCAPGANYDNSRRRLLCHLPMCEAWPSEDNPIVVVDIDRIAAQTQVNPYELLGISKSASASEARAAYRTASLQWHPDRNPQCGKECEDKMSEITKAYELIKKRKAPAPPDRTWEGWMKAIVEDWKNVFEVLFDGRS